MPGLCEDDDGTDTWIFGGIGMILSHKIDFLCVIVAENCNPNGDPLVSNRPRIDFDGYGEMSHECIKRKIRNRLQDMGERIFVQSDDRCDDGFYNLKERVSGVPELKEILSSKTPDREKYKKIACEMWIDVRSFGQVFAFKGDDVSASVRGPVSVSVAKTIDRITINDYGITRSTNTIPGSKKDSATFGKRYTIDNGVYVFKGGIYPELAEKTGFSDEDAEKIKQALLTLFDNDASNSRPNGSMTVAELYWWEHKGKQSMCAPVKLFRSVELIPDDKYPYFKSELHPLEGIAPSVYKMI